MSFLSTGLRELGLKVRRQRTRMTLRHVQRQLQRSEIQLGREGTSQAVNFPEVRDQIVALKKLEQEQREVAIRIAQLEEGLKHLEAERRENTKAQSDAIASLELEKKPLVQRADEARRTAELCARELGSVEARLQANDAADRDLLKQISTLQAQAPPPEDLEARVATLSSQRARLPAERDEIARAREGSAEASRDAKSKLGTANDALALAEKNIGKVRGEFEARDRELGAKAQAQQEAIREARGHHATVEGKKDPAYLNIGRHLGNRGIAPPNAPHLLRDVLRHRQAVAAHLAHSEQLKVISAQIDRQDLRKFYFTIISLLLLGGLIVLVYFQRPSRREWLPAEADTILSLNIEKFERDEAVKKWRSEAPDSWKTTWHALLGPAAQTPHLKIIPDTARVTRASSASGGPEFVLVEATEDVAPVVRSLSEDIQFEKRSLNGLAIWQQGNFAIARVGPRTLALGEPNGVDALVRVRLGLTPDLPTTAQLLDHFQSLERDCTLVLVSRDPGSLARVFHPIFAPALLQRADILGLALWLEKPVKAHLLLKLPSASAADDLAKEIRADPKPWLKLEQTDLDLSTEKPQLKVNGTTLDLRFNCPESSARLLLEKIAKTDASIPTTAANP